jgi:peptide-methionine (S)-S-oxide reductase
MVAQRSEVATLGGGCFWCIEAVLLDLKGVERVESGYAGGSDPNPTYRSVCSGATGHAEVVQVTFDPDQLAYEDLLRVFFAVHDPTTPDRQGADVGTQYRSVIFTHSPEQRATAERVIQDLEAAKLWSGPIVTELAPLTRFHRAEDYHQEYYERNPDQPYCRAVIAPKLAKFRKQYVDKLRK